MPTSRQRRLGVLPSTRAGKAGKRGPALSGIGALLLMVSGATSTAAEVLHEADVIRLSRAVDPHVTVARAEADLARAEELRADLYPNPALGWEREALPGLDPGESEDTIALAVPVVLSGRRSAARALSRAEAATRDARAVRLQSEAIEHGLALFYAALAEQERAESATRIAERLDEAVRVVTRRQQEGTASGYDQHRLQVEVQLAHSERREAVGRSDAARQRLAVFLGLAPSQTQLSGSLDSTLPARQLSETPRGSAEPASSTSGPLRRSTELERSSLAETRRASESAESAWVPELELSGGLRIARSDATRYGYVAGVSVSLPIFSRGQELRAEAEAKQRLAAARAAAWERDARLGLAQATSEYRLASAELQRFQAELGDTLERLQRALESGYREGERTVVELVDAGRARAAVERRRLELKLAAKRAQLRMRAARGEFER